MKLTSCSDGRKVGLPLYTAPPPHLPHAVHLPWLGAFRQAQLRKVGQAAQPSVEGDEDTVVLEGGGGGGEGSQSGRGCVGCHAHEEERGACPVQQRDGFRPSPPSTIASSPLTLTPVTMP